MYLSNDNILILLLLIAFLVLFATMNIIHKQSITNHKYTIEPFELDCDFKHKDSPCCILRNMKKRNGKFDELKSRFLQNPYLVIDPVNGPYHYREHIPILDSSQEWLLEMERSCNLNTITKTENPLLQYDVMSHYDAMKKWKETMVQQRKKVEKEYRTASSQFKSLHRRYNDLVQEYKTNLANKKRLDSDIPTRKQIIQTIEDIDRQLEYRSQLRDLENEIDRLMTKEASFKDRVQNIVQQTIDYIRDLPTLYFEGAKLYESFIKSAPFIDEETYPSTLEDRSTLVTIRTESKTKYDDVKSFIAASETQIKNIIDTLTNYMFCNKLLSKANNNLQTNNDINMTFTMPNETTKNIVFNNHAYIFNHVKFESAYYKQLRIDRLFKDDGTGFVSMGTTRETIHRLPNDIDSNLEHVLREAIGLEVPTESVATAIAHKFLNEAFKGIETDAIDDTKATWEQKCGYIKI